MIHHHRANQRHTTVRPFSHPVVDLEDQNPQAHGGAEYTEVCRCGATRKTLTNGRHVEMGAWVDASAAQGEVQP